MDVPNLVGQHNNVEVKVPTTLRDSCLTGTLVTSTKQASSAFATKGTVNSVSDTEDFSRGQMVKGLLRHGQPTKVNVSHPTQSSAGPQGTLAATQLTLTGRPTVSTSIP